MRRRKRDRGRQAWTDRLRQLISRSNLLLRASALLFLIVLVVMLAADEHVAHRAAEPSGSVVAGLNGHAWPVNGQVLR